MPHKSAPQYAHTKQKIATATYRIEGGKAVELVSVEGSYLSFDKFGKITDRLVGNLSADLQAHVNIDADQSGAPSTMNVDDPQLSKEEWHRTYRWTPSLQELELITEDIFNRRPAPQLRPINVLAVIRELLTDEEKRSIDEIEMQLHSVVSQLERLSEQSLSNICFAARQKRVKELEPLWQGVANAADRHGNILARYRTGEGVWYASVAFVKWNKAHHFGSSDIVAYRKCRSKSEAEVAHGFY